VGGGGFWLWRAGIAAAVYNGFGGAVVELTAAAGFRVGEVFLEGRNGSEKEELMAALQVQRGDPIFGVSLTEARSALEKLPWIAGASIERHLPDTLLVRLTERQPMALWQFDRRLVLIDRFGTILAEQGVERFAHLPIVVGRGAPEHAPDLLNQLALAPVLAARIGAAVWVGNRRWDLRLDNGINIRLPESDYGAAITRLSALMAKDSILDKDLAVIDLRLPDRMTFQTSTGIVQRRRPQGEKI
jgi:cell division protein FtsQ